MVGGGLPKVDDQAVHSMLSREDRQRGKRIQLQVQLVTIIYKLK